ncbi:MAG: class I SAM-dependent methyltransferase [Nitrospirae bacterium]|nr:class I SAM-dependent methyltransferase [Candidatus Manganitrophaceae bacterium]
MQSPPLKQERKKREDNQKWDTLAAYTAQADLYLAEWDRRKYRIPPLLEVWARALPEGARLLDLGCGPAQDSRYLRSVGFRPVGVDGTWPFLLRARRHSRRLSLVQADFEALPFRIDTFDGLWAAASLIHLPKKRLQGVLSAARALTHRGGTLAATFAHGSGEGPLRQGWIPGRYFSYWEKEALAEAVRKAGWKILFLKTVRHQERRGRWLNLIAERG